MNLENRYLDRWKSKKVEWGWMRDCPTLRASILKFNPPTDLAGGLLLSPSAR